MYQPRVYRHWVMSKDLVSFRVVVKETDLLVRASRDLERKTYRLVARYRGDLERYIAKNPDFLTSLVPLPVPEQSPAIVRAMSEAARKVDVGPMASVAGAINDFVGNALLEFSPEIIIENGGDIYLRSLKKRVIGIYAGKSPLTGKIGLELAPTPTPIGICTSSGTVGHSLSFGAADAVAVVAESSTLADAAATALGNRVGSTGDIQKAIDFARSVEGLKGVVIICGSDMGLWGDIKLCETAHEGEGEITGVEKKIDG